MFIIPDKTAAIHKAWLYRVLEAVADDAHLASVLYFKGGTCASMLGWLDRFSVDLDFDYIGTREDVPRIRMELESLFSKLDLTIKQASKKGIQYLLKYDTAPNTRNTLKIEVAFPIPAPTIHEPQRFTEIDRVLICQSRETMFSNKLVAAIDRFKRNGHVAGRDIYDINHFFLNGYTYSDAIIFDRTGMNTKEFLIKLAEFIEKEVTEKILTEDLSFLLMPQEFAQVRKNLKWQVLFAIRHEIACL